MENWRKVTLYWTSFHFQSDWDWQSTEAEYKRAIELNPNLAGSYVGYAYFLQAMGRHQEALAAAHRAVELTHSQPRTSATREGSFTAHVNTKARRAIPAGPRVGSRLSSGPRPASQMLMNNWGITMKRSPT